MTGQQTASDGSNPSLIKQIERMQSSRVPKSTTKQSGPLLYLESQGETQFHSFIKSQLNMKQQVT